MEKKVLLFSGGFDSMLQEWLIKPDILLYVDMRTSYSNREVEALLRLPDHYTHRMRVIHFPLGEYERDNKYLPYRNMFLAGLAMQYGQHVYFGFNEADDAPDKDDTFIRRLTTLFRHLNKHCIGDMGWETTNFSFSAPYKHLTKTEMVAECLKQGMPVDWIRGIRSCYDSESVIGCGVCRPCVNRAVALINNGIYSPELFDTPITADRIADLMKETREYDGGNYSKRYYADLQKAKRLLR